MAIAPPKCKTCGKAEWQHLCSGPEEYVEGLHQRLIETIEYPIKPSRKEYLKLKARERRARQKAAKT